MDTVMDATPHHVGCAVELLEDAYETYGGVLGLRRRTRPFDVASQNVRVCFVELVGGFYLELVAPLDEKAQLASFLDAGFYHLCFLVDELGAAREHLKARGFFTLDAFASEAFGGNLCQFFLSPQEHLIEIAQMSPQNFGAFFRANLAGEG